MKRSKTLLLIFFISIHAIAQESEKSVLKFSSVSIFGGSGFDSGVPTSLSDFNKLTSNSQLLNSDFSTFESNNFSKNYTSNTSVYFNFEINSKKESPMFKDKTLRLGVSFSNSNPFSLGYYKDDYYRIDTLSSSRTGKETYIDSVHSQNFTAEYQQQSVFLKVAYLVNTNRLSRFSFYAGLEMSLGFSIGNSTNLTYYEYDSYDGYDGFGKDDFKKKRNSTTESFRNKSSLGMIASIPLGIDFRVGKKREFWKRCHFILEYQPGLTVTSVPEIGTLTNTSNMGSGGVRYEF